MTRFKLRIQNGKSTSISAVSILKDLEASLTMGVADTKK